MTLLSKQVRDSRGHNSVGKADVQPRHSIDLVWWVIAGLFSVAALRLPEVTGFDLGTRELVCQAGLFLGGLVVGAYRPRRAWRWALAGFLAVGLSDFAHLGSQSHLPELEFHDMLSHLTHGVPDWALHTLPVLVGAYVGAFLRRESLD